MIAFSLRQWSNFPGRSSHLRRVNLGEKNSQTKAGPRHRARLMRAMMYVHLYSSHKARAYSTTQELSTLFNRLDLVENRLEAALGEQEAVPKIAKKGRGALLLRLQVKLMTIPDEPIKSAEHTFTAIRFKSVLSARLLSTSDNSKIPLAGRSIRLSPMSQTILTSSYSP